jgi:hypothetical protein
VKRIAACLLVLMSSTVLAAKAELPATVEYVRTKDVKAQWPGDNDREALVFLRFNVTPEGKAIDIELAEGGFHEPRFVDAAMRGLRKGTFYPAVKNGAPVAVRGQVIPFRFSIGSAGVTPEFRAELMEVNTFIKSGDYAGAHFHAQWMLTEKVKLSYEYALLQAELAHTHFSVGNTHRALTAARAATRKTSPEFQLFRILQEVPRNSASNYMLPKPIVESLLQLRMRLAASKGLILEALQTYYELAGLTPLNADDPYKALAQQIIKELEGNMPLIGQMRIDESTRWVHEPFRRTFAIVNVRGTISDINLQCEDKARTVSYKADVELTIPDSWGHCGMWINGEPGTEFDLVEYPPEAVAAASALKSEGVKPQ